MPRLAAMLLVAGPLLFATPGAHAQAQIGLPCSGSSDAPLVQQAAASVVQVLNGPAAGSGVRVAPGVLTAEHLVGDAAQVDVVLSTGQHVQGTVVRTDAQRDLALLAVAAPLPDLELAPAGQHRTGDELVVVSYPCADGQPGPPTSASGLLQAVVLSQGVTFLQTDAAMSPSSSGGAVLDRDGKLVGMAVAALRDTAGLNVAIASETVEAFLSGVSGPTEARGSPGVG